MRSRGRNWSNALLALQVAPGATETTRCGFVVSRRVGDAVTRNKVRRRLREIVYPRLVALDAVHDLALVARVAAARATYAQLEEAVNDLMRRALLRTT